MTDPAITLSASLLADIFPFHLAINRKGELMQIGKTLQRLYPELKTGNQFEQYFQVQRPATAFNFDTIQTHFQSLFILEVQSSSMLLKGQMVYAAEQNLLLFLGSPWVPNLNALASSGLALADFAIHDPIADYLVLLQTQEMALADARKLADKLKQQRAEVRKALDRERELNDLKSRFITTASHEFRTPLGIIASSTGIMQDYAAKIDNTVRQKHLARIQAAVSRMTALLDDVLTMSQVEAGTLKVHLQPLNLVAFCQEIVEGFQESTAHTFTHIISRSFVDRPISLDPNLLNQLLSNLLSNAIKYTPEPGNILLDMRYQEDQVVFVVQDSGIGIPQEELTSILNPFHRASNVGNIAGTGLGLAIAKHCIDLHGGSITIASEVGVGTTITVTLPLQSATTLNESNEESIRC